MKHRFDTRSRWIHTRAALKQLHVPNISVLDLGSRDGGSMAEIQENGNHGRLVATDVHHRIENGVEFIPHDLEELLPFEDNSFDVVVCTDVIEHIERKHQLAAEISRVSKGKAIISLPNTQHYKYVRGLKRGNMGKQYVFSVEDGSDRHRWVTFYKSNLEFLAKHFVIEEQIDICDNKFDRAIAPLNRSKYVRNQFVLCSVRP